MAVKVNDLIRERDGLRKKGSLTEQEKSRLSSLNAQVRTAQDAAKKKGCGCSRNKG